MKIEITAQGPVGCGKGLILAKLKRFLEGHDWVTTATIENPVHGEPSSSFTATKDREELD